MFAYSPNMYDGCRKQPVPSEGNRPLFATGVFWREISPQQTRQEVFSQSLRVTSNRDQANISELLETVQVLPSSTGHYQIYRPRTYNSSNDISRSSSMAQLKPVEVRTVYKHNISNPDKNKSVGQRPSSTMDSTRVKKFQTKGKITPQSIASKLQTESDLECSCKTYHSHVFLDDTVNMEIMRQEEQRMKIVKEASDSELLAEGNEDPRNIFWTPALSFHPYKHGDQIVEFTSLWPTKKELREHLQNTGILTTVLRGAVLDLGRQAIVCGPIQLLECLIQLCLIRVDQQFENGSSMLHLACLSRNMESVRYLTSIGISPKIQDKHGYTADQVTFCPKVRRLLPPKYQNQRDTSLSNRMHLRPSLQDKDTIFSLAKNPKNFDDIQKRLQTFDFNVNTECDGNGDFLLHIACCQGLAQLPLIMALVKIQQADIELCNANGMTPVMLTAIAGNSVLCDVLICLFGANPNKSNPHNGSFALHYAVEGNHRKTVECLIRRGADVNAEDHEGRRPDDIPACIGPDDCCEIVAFHRKKRLESLSQNIKEGNIDLMDILFTDLFVVDEQNYTLIMISALNNQVEAMSKLLITNKTTINAQHCKTGMTALAISAQKGYRSCCQLLLQQGANPAIGDMQGYLPLHHAVCNNHEAVVDLFLDFFPVCFVGLFEALKMSKKSSIHEKLKVAWDKRQDEIVTPTLLSCAFNGDAEELFVLLDEGDCINPKSGSGNWPMYLAVENGHLDVVKLLLEKGGEIKRRHGATGATVLHVAARMGHYHMMEYLVKFSKTNGGVEVTNYYGGKRKKVDINAVDAENKTALQVAAEKGLSRMVQLLLNHGATTALLDSQGLLFTCCDYEGVRMLIESNREQHTKQVMNVIANRSKKAVYQLQKMWLPRFDHNLRTKQGDTPLMKACELGRVEIVKFLLESAVYPNFPSDEDSEDDSDTDSGVLDNTWAVRRKQKMFKFDEGENVSQLSTTFNQSTEVSPGGADDFSHSGEINRSDMNIDSSPESKTLHVLLKDVEKPKGLQIFHETKISHVCAVNLFTGYTALHYAIEGGENIPIIKALLSADINCLNTQNNDGLSPLHLACKLVRKKSIQLLLTHEEIDVNLRTLQGQIPEEMTTNKSIIKLIQKTRLNQTGQSKPPAAQTESPFPSSPSSMVGSTIDFDKVHNKYEALKKEVKFMEQST